MRTIRASELILNADGSVFHLHLRPEQLADRIILVGDPARVEVVASYFDRIESRTAHREFVSATGTYRGTRLTVLSHGIGADNIDIVMTELDTLVNVDFQTRTVREQKKKLYMLRLGTCGALQPNLRIGDRVLAEISIGFDGLLNFYAGCKKVCDLSMEGTFVEHMKWSSRLAMPYFVRSSSFLNQLFAGCSIPGITISAPGFYGPQGRVVRLALADPEMNGKLETFRYGEKRILNYEMESSALAGLAALLGHEATTLCTVIAQRIQGDSEPDYTPHVQRMIELALDKITGF
ncbi:MAG: nucleoside phosphorylase [Rikenellaceae bacterium]|nr:nucleoside phosphorylase [Rikenellaceae bacterium]